MDGKVDHRTNMRADALTVHKLTSYYIVCFCPDAVLVANCMKFAAWVPTDQLQQCSMNSVLVYVAAAVLVNVAAAVLVNVAAAEGLLLLQGGR